MNFLGIDYGRRTVGLAVSSGRLAAPLKTLSIKSDDDLLLKLKAIVRAEHVGIIVIGLPDGLIATAVKKLLPRLERALGVEVIAWDETLTSQTAQTTMRQSGVPQKKRRHREDAIAATLILQSYLDASR